MSTEQPLFDASTWERLPDYFENLPEPVQLVVWAQDQKDPTTITAARLVLTLGDRFETIDAQLLMGDNDFTFYPVIGVMGIEDGKIRDYGIRLFGLPAGFQMTSLIAAVQCVSFKGTTSEARTRIQLRRLSKKVTLEVITTAADENGAVMAQTVFNLAVFSPLVSGYLIMGDAFPQWFMRYSIENVPHTVINQRVHVEGIVDEETLLRHIAAAL